jgi:predicted amidophosphoribosyltransferase
MAAQIAANAPEAMLEGTLVPVPLHSRRLRRRGYNQAALIADALASRTGLEVVDCLRRAGSAASIELRAAAPGRVVLVDDVATTGATLAACAGALRAAGSIEVAALVFARTIGR